ncbi:hypothetical protein DEU38_10836 [Rhodococcus sp. AG1013]|nr:hypothetical protein DEU38_10836 [Rhodococcus sp. AG1013]
MRIVRTTEIQKPRRVIDVQDRPLVRFTVYVDENNRAGFDVAGGTVACGQEGRAIERPTQIQILRDCQGSVGRQLLSEQKRSL